MENWEVLKESPMIRVMALHRDDWRKYTGMINKLVQQLSPGVPQVTEDDFFQSVGQEDFTVFIARHLDQPEGEFIGMATIFFRKLLSGWIGEIHDVVVDEKYYRQGFGRLLTKHIFDYAKVMAEKNGKPFRLYLTSKPGREAANQMYQSEGFKIVASATMLENGTNLYRKTIEP